MTTEASPEAPPHGVAPLFPALERYVREQGLTEKAKGDLAVKLARILGGGTSRARNLKAPPPPVERTELLGSIKLPGETPADVQQEINLAREATDERKKDLRRDEGKRRFAVSVLKPLEQRGIPIGLRNNYYFAGPVVLRPEKNGWDWAWSLTPRYDLVSRLPADEEFVVQAHAAALDLLAQTVRSPKEFERQLDLAWALARHFADSDDVLIVDVARLYKVAAQSDAFWRTPERRLFEDLPEAAFLANLMNWRHRRQPSDTPYEFVSATLHQSDRAFWIPVSEDGTEVHPFIYMRRRGQVRA